MARPAKRSAGIIGLGIIGSRVVPCLRKNGFQTWLWNRSPRTEPNFLSSAAEVAEATKHIQIFVSDGPALISVVRALAPALTPEHVIMNHATVSPQETRDAAEIVAGRHAKFLDAPFTGSRDAAERGELVYYIGGDADVLATVRPVLEASAKTILEIGDIGQASVVKIATNLISATTVSALAEAHALLHQNGVELRKLSLALREHAARSTLGDAKTPLMLTGKFDPPNFSLKHMFKDVQLALGLAAEKHLELPTASAFIGSAMAGIQHGWSDFDFSVISCLYGFPGQGHKPPETPAENAPATSQDSAKKATGRWRFFGGKK